MPSPCRSCNGLCSASLEVTHREAREHLSVETQRQWSDQAIGRTTPVLFGLFSVVTLLAHALAQRGQVLTRQTAWYTKAWPAFSDALAAVRFELWRPPTFHTSKSNTADAFTMCYENATQVWHRRIAQYRGLRPRYSMEPRYNANHVHSQE